MLKKLAILLCTVGLAACNTMSAGTNNTPSDISGGSGSQSVNPFQSWWSFYDDDILDRLVTSALSLNPLVAAGDKKSVTGGDAQSDAAVISSYKDMRVGLVKAVVQNYIEYRYIQNQKHLLSEYMAEQTAALEVADAQSAKILEIELDALLERKNDYEKRQSQILEQLAASTRLLPEFISELMRERQPVPTYDLSAAFLTDTRHVLVNTAHVQAALAQLRKNVGDGIARNEAVSVFPSVPLNVLFGISDQVYSKENFLWRVSIGHAVRALEFEQLEGRVFYKRDIQEYKDTVTAYILDVERILVAYATLEEQAVVLQAAIEDADESNIYKAKLAGLRAAFEKSKTVTELFDTLNLY
ncbi:MAG: hypothetical protein ACTHOO_04665 [Alcanivorax sp.]